MLIIYTIFTKFEFLTGESFREHMEELHYLDMIEISKTNKCIWKIWRVMQRKWIRWVYDKVAMEVSPFFWYVPPNFSDETFSLEHLLRIIVQVIETEQGWFFSGFKLFAKVSLGFNQYTFSDRAALHLGHSDMPRWIQLFRFVHHSFLINNDNCRRANSDYTESCRFFWLFFFMARSNHCASESEIHLNFFVINFLLIHDFQLFLLQKAFIVSSKADSLDFFCYRFYFWLMSFTSCSWTCTSHDLHCTYANTEKEHLASSRNQSRWLNKWCYSNFNKL